MFWIGLEAGPLSNTTQADQVYFIGSTKHFTRDPHLTENMCPS
jgi:hypothetical protein